jgi:hypothetical protein
MEVPDGACRGSASVDVDVAASNLNCPLGRLLAFNEFEIGNHLVLSMVVTARRILE